MKPIPFGRYLLLDRLAIGGMAEVYVAAERDDRAGRLFALKRMLPTLAEDEEFVSMFLDEARIVAQLAHPSLVAVHDLGKQGDTYYIASEYVPGKDLRAMLGRTRRMGEQIPVPLAAYLGFRVADALDYAHRKRDAQGRELRVVHRDVSPANVLVGFDGSVRIIDFGIAQAAFRTRREETVLRGKFGYMSPEAASGDAVDRRSDVFALGVVLHEILTGARLFTGPTELAVLERVRSGEIPPPSRLNPAVPPGLDAVVLRALARDVGERWAWASELRDALAPWVHAGTPAGDPPALARFMARQFPAELRAELDRVERLQAPVPAEDVEVLDVLAPPEPDATVVAPPEVVLRERRSRWKGAVAGLVVLLLLAGSAVVALARARDAAGPTTGRIVVQPLGAARLLVDGALHPPDLAPGEVRSVEVGAGLHRIELVTDDGRTAAATVDVAPGQATALLRIELR
jgi:eukaryotic-like serine/threonine-protein kinase